MAVRRLPVVMIHGAFCGGWSFAEWRDVYDARGFAVHIPTLRHHRTYEEAMRSLGDVSIRDYCEDICELIDGLEATPVIIGHSLGGLLAQMLAARGRARAIILLAPLAPWGIFPSIAMEWLAMQALYWDRGFRKKVLKPVYSVASAHALELLDEQRRTVILQRLVPESGRAIFEAMHWMFDSERTTFVDPRRVTCPVLCLAGARDRIVSPETVRRIARRYSGRARYECLAGAGHWLPGEPSWRRIATGTLNWLNQTVGRKSEIM